MASKTYLIENRAGKQTLTWLRGIDVLRNDGQKIAHLNFVALISRQALVVDLPLEEGTDVQRELNAFLKAHEVQESPSG